MSDGDGVKVQSGVGLGIKIALGFFLFSCLLSGGVCCACGGLASLPGAVSSFNKFQHRDAGTTAP